jgi:hypothetical protein
MDSPLAIERQPMIGEDRAKSGHSGDQRFSSAAEAGEVVWHDAPGQHLYLAVEDPAVNQDRRAEAGGSQFDGFFFLTAIMTQATDPGNQILTQQRRHIALQMLLVRAIGEKDRDAVIWQASHFQFTNQRRHVLPRPCQSSLAGDQDGGRFFTAGNVG